MNPLGLFCNPIEVIENSIRVSFHVAHNMMGFSYLFMFILVEELDSATYPEDVQESEEFDSPAYLGDFQEVEVKDEPLEYDAVSCEAILEFFLTALWFFVYFYLILDDKSILDYDITHKEFLTLANCAI